MPPSLEDILTDIQRGAILPADAVAKLDHDAILDARDSDPNFEAEWSRVSNDIERRWAESNVDAVTKNMIEDIRRESFLTVSNATAQHEIASYVSDDFDIIARSVAIDIRDHFIDLMWDAYCRQTIPMPD